MSIPSEIPDTVASGGVAKVIGFMLEQGFSKKEHGFDEGPWEQSQYRSESETHFGVANNTLVKILHNKNVTERVVRTVASSLLKSLPDGHVIKEMWIECALNQPQVIKSKPYSRAASSASNERPELMKLDGVWAYILRRHNGEKFQRVNEADYVVGVFLWESMSISTAYNYGYFVEQGILTQHKNWYASDCGVGKKSVFIPYRNDYYNTIDKDRGVSGLIHAKYEGFRTVKTGRLAIRGSYFDTDTGSIEDGGQFYAEQFGRSADDPFDLSTDTAKLLSEVFEPIAH